MKAQAKLLNNRKEINQSEITGINVPEEYVYNELLFLLIDLRQACILSDGENIKLCFDNDNWIVKFETELWKSIQEHFEKL